MLASIQESIGSSNHVVSTRESIDIYQSNNYTIFARLSSRGGPILISFVGRDGTTEPFGEEAYAKYGINTVHVTCRGPQWFQYADSAVAGEAIRLFCQDYTSRIAYGVSMGGYGALMFSGIIQADLVLTWSPQYSLDHAKVPFEHRWDREANDIRSADGFVFDDMASNISSTAEIFVIYDPIDNDRLHTELIDQSRTGVNLICMPFSRHAAIKVAREMGIVSWILRHAVRRSLNARAIRNEFRLNRYKSAYYLRAAAHTLKQRNKSGILALVRSAVKVSSPTDSDGIWSDVRMLLHFGDDAAAAEQMLILLGLPRYLARPTSVGDAVKFGPALLRSGRIEDAVAALAPALAGAPRLPASKKRDCMIHATLIAARLLALAGQPDAALANLRQVAALGAGPDMAVPMAEIYAASGDAAQSIALLQEAAIRAPDDAVIVKALADRQEKAGLPDEALQTYAEAARRIDLPLLPHRLAYGRLLGRAGRHAEGLVELDTVLAATPEHGLAHRQRAAFLAALERHEEACTAFRAACADPFQRGPALQGLAKSCLALGRLEDALAAMQQAAMLAPNNASLPRSIARIEALMAARP